MYEKVFEINGKAYRLNGKKDMLGPKISLVEIQNNGNATIGLATRKIYLQKNHRKFCREKCKYFTICKVYRIIRTPKQKDLQDIIANALAEDCRMLKPKRVTSHENEE